MRSLFLLGFMCAVPLAAQDSRWLGPDLWANRLQDWRRVADTLECVAPGNLPRRTVHLLTKELTGRGAFVVRARFRPIGGAPRATAAAGFLLGVGGAMDWRSRALVHHWPGNGGGLFIGMDGRGHLFRASNEQPWQAPGGAGTPWRGAMDLIVTGAPVQGIPGTTIVRLQVLAADGQERATTIALPTARLRGGIALVSHCGQAKTEGGHRFEISGWQASGPGVAEYPERTFGPIACTQYTVSRGVLSMTAQLLPVTVADSDRVFLEVRREGAWQRIAAAAIVTPGWTAHFRLRGWNADRDVPYRVVYGDAAPWSGTVRRDPAANGKLVLAAFTGNHNNSHAIGGGWGLGKGDGRTAPNDWVAGMWFPHGDITQHVSAHRPDLLFFSGDQVYEGKSPTFADRHKIELDYLYKWYLWCWAYRELTRDIPCVTMPDDHDVYQGNIWGQGGRKAPGRDTTGGYVHPASFVRMVERTQTAHLPPPVDPAPVEQGIGVYFTELLWGRVSFAILEDRKFKSGCAGIVPEELTAGRPDHVIRADWDPTCAEGDELVLLGERQLQFLERWAGDWRGADLKAALSQTMFAALSTHHGAGLQWYAADLDANGWPRAGRDRAVAALRRAFAVHIAGDQHLATVVQHGIDAQGDGIWSFCVPSIANFYPRAWTPGNTGPYQIMEPEQYTGAATDGFGNRVHVVAATNPGPVTGHLPTDLHDRMPGYGIIVFDQATRTVEFQCWPRHQDPRAAGARQYTGWPVTVRQQDNDGRRPSGHLPRLEIAGLQDPVVRVFDQQTGRLVYALRVRGNTFRPPVFGPGPYRVAVGCPDRGVDKVFEGLRPGTDATLEVSF